MKDLDDFTQCECECDNPKTFMDGMEQKVFCESNKACTKANCICKLFQRKKGKGHEEDKHEYVADEGKKNAVSYDKDYQWYCHCVK